MAFRFKYQLPVTPLPKDLNLSGQTILITGANIGLGLESARQLLLHHASTVFLCVRNVSKGAAARTHLLSLPEIKFLPTLPEIKVLHVDMDDYESVKKFVVKVKEEVGESGLDAVLLNAGMGQLKFETSAQTGHELGLQVNYLSNVLLALLLLPLLEKTAVAKGVPSRLSIVGSRTQYVASFVGNKQPFIPGQSLFSRMDDKKMFSGMTAYGDNKLLVALFVYELAKRVDSGKVIVNNMCPGQTATNLTSRMPFPLRQIVNAYIGVYGRSVEVGGYIVVHALVVAGKESHGRFLHDKEVTEPSPFSVSEEGKIMQKQLWEESMEEMRKVDPSTASMISTLV